MSLFLRIYQHLLPDAAAWRTTTAKTLRKLFEGDGEIPGGLAAAPADARDYIDAVYEDAFPDTTRALATWEAQFGLEPNADEATRRLALAAAWAAGGGQDPSYLQGVLQTAGFDVYVHEWWVPPDVAPRVARDPHDYTTVPLMGTTQCTGTGAGQPQCGDGVVPVDADVVQYQCDRFLMNDPGYLVNENLTREAPPPIPSDPATWRYFIYIGGETFPDTANVDELRRAEFERLLLKLRPLNDWIVTLVVYVGTLLTEAGDPILTEASVELSA